MKNTTGRNLIMCIFLSIMFQENEKLLERDGNELMNFYNESEDFDKELIDCVFEILCGSQLHVLIKQAEKMTEDRVGR